MRTSILAAALVPAAAVGVALAVLRPWDRPAPPKAAPEAAAAYAAVPPPAPAPAPPAAKPDDLPTVAVQPFAVHAAPSDAATLPAKPYTIVALNGRVAEQRPAPEPRPRPAMQASLEPATPAPTSLSGHATAAGGTLLDIEGRRLSLFGVKLVPHGDSAATSAALQAHLTAAPAVTCMAPPGQSGTPAFICRDPAGVDLGELLVSQGLAAADRSKSYQYVSAEERARAQHRGNWR